MSSKYKPLHPSQYPGRWLYAANKCAENPQVWVSVEATVRENQALSRMCRMRAFHKGLQLHPKEAPAVTAARENKMELRFRKVFRHGMWDVQMSLQPCAMDLGEIFANAGK